MPVNQRRLEVHEIFALLEKANSKKKKIEVLQANNIMPVRDVLQGIFDDRVQWNMPTGTPPYTPTSDQAPPPKTLLREHLKFKYFVKGLRESESLPSVKRERMFIDILETVHPADASLLVDMINKKSPVKGLTIKTVKEAYPDLIPD